MIKDENGQGCDQHIARSPSNPRWFWITPSTTSSPLYFIHSKQMNTNSPKIAMMFLSGIFISVSHVNEYYVEDDNKYKVFCWLGNIPW